MKRRDFLTKLPALALPFVINGTYFNILADTLSPLQRLAANCPNDRVLIILQLHGGNDGINMLLPVSDYDRYYNVRANIAIPDKGARAFIRLDSTLANTDQIGLHPDMVGVKSMYDQGLVRMIQGVSYENHNQSHFRGRDILFMGGGSSDYLTSGWAGRYLKNNYAPDVYPADFPNANMPDPLALEFNDDLSLVFHQDDNIPTSIAIDDPESFFDLVDTLPGYNDKPGIDARGIPPASVANSPYGKEMNWILNLEEKSDEYHSRILQVYNKGKATDPNISYPVSYPLNAPKQRVKNPLSAKLKIIANLIQGGSKTKIYLIRMGGFDTHAQQVETTSATMGNHAALMYHISSAMRAFQDDLKARSIDERVLTMTTSEFGRRIYSNGSYGTDHGIGAPMMLFGKGVVPGLSGTNPDLTQDNVAMQFDYRQVYASILKDWMCVDASLVDNEFGILWGNYPGRGTTLPIINNNLISSVNDFVRDRFYMNNCYPNPAVNFTDITFYINTSCVVTISLHDSTGKLIKNIVSETYPVGESKVSVDLREIKAGMYFYQIETSYFKDAKKIVIQK
ncbi:DUF1501 domain-containing protein [Cytophaga hutchinsonii]|uniref:Secretion system C-terminal sorting domain-containing protein n=1 Tax=Cytophaga hutchinsonii (strain ATCC 33406 / DSM 1761 / CIP 103989 / NBRC 15051 / NCIMB 9469 / D465) TaxID=269798 RepID=A0A6N4SVW4_CYTH3|nr:DUF1501 domain-containing protein [Cytophaga hutchinsonii]ABG60600.1 conserved hypothetical protein [Cytophaga hutchinsonii ATCC 33406]SFX89204.1 Por secretion system C-terminal sorting domain-containing protein [Cytophaga hutchinsonii ATCC 33406]